jgi:hypothetical protein
MTAVGRVRLARTFLVADPSGFPADDALGIDGYLSRGARRMATLAGLQRSFVHAESLLKELSGWELDDNTIRKITHETARDAAERRAERSDATRFAEAKGEPEVAIDAGKVNTLTGWRDVKMAVISRREAGKPATPAEWDTRELPAPTIRTVVAAIEDSEAFAERVRTETDRLNVTTAADATVLADGGEWIWNLVAMVLPLATGVLDVYHAIENLGKAVRAIWGDGEESERRRSEGVAILLSEGKAGIERWMGEAIASVPEGRSTEPLLELAGYLSHHPTHLGYGERLSSGRSIGSGQVEGAVKELVNLRMKRTGARWRADHVGPLVELLALSTTPEWNDIWIAI